MSVLNKYSIPVITALVFSIINEFFQEEFEFIHFIKIFIVLSLINYGMIYTYEHVNLPLPEEIDQVMMGSPPRDLLMRKYA